ncbi:hypothetical protein ACFOHK_20965 [Falsigemmobacter intermedius]|uniref:Uncharacterized protein n=1 Tax=Falsigemmobacter intermedius TaxID=1553448 RepID=A0A451GGG1_9RHOB|nr:hypothetical protein [Falsigemmobacter intermedius]RWY35610.1 hypothetical protein EP867_18615 [Falsigemmobacter intermedius]
MSKKKPSMADAFNDLPKAVAAPRGEQEKPPAVFSLTDDDRPKVEAGIAFKILKHERQQLKEWCARHDMTIKEIFLHGWADLKKKKGP